MENRCLVFDCMETLVDMKELPKPSDYALWAFEKSGAEGLWDDFDDFFRAYASSKQNHHEHHGPYREQDLLERLNHLVKEAFLTKQEIPSELKGLTEDQVTAMLFDNFWTNYTQRCYVKKEVVDALQFFKDQYFSMGVVSNFTVRGGIEEILEKCGIRDYFSFIHTSVSNAYRKPHPNIFYEVLRSCGCEADRVIYLGDDYECDFVGASRFGFNAYLLDRKDRYRDVHQRVSTFEEFVETVKQICP